MKQSDITAGLAYPRSLGCAIEPQPIAICAATGTAQFLLSSPVTVWPGAKEDRHTLDTPTRCFTKHRGLIKSNSGRLMRHPALLFAALVACQTAGSLGLQGTQESQGNAADTAALYISFSTPQQGETRRIFARDNLDVRVYVNELTPQHHRDCSRYTLLLMMNDSMAEDFSLCSCFNEPAAEVDRCEVVYFFPNMRSSSLTLSAHILGSADEVLAETTLDFYLLVRNDTVLHDAATKGHLWLTDDAAQLGHRFSLRERQ